MAPETYFFRWPHIASWDVMGHYVKTMRFATVPAGGYLEFLEALEEDREAFVGFVVSLRPGFDPFGRGGFGSRGGGLRSLRDDTFGYIPFPDLSLS
jgi:hypothetical protein